MPESASIYCAEWLNYRLKRMLRYRFEEALWGNEKKEQRDAVVVSYWWD